MKIYISFSFERGYNRNIQKNVANEKGVLLQREGILQCHVKKILEVTI